VLDSSQSDSTNVNTNNEVRIGSLSSGFPRFFNGYISNVRVTNSAVYISALSPPVAPLTSIAGSILLLNSANSGLIDYTGKNVLETVETAQLSTAITKFGNASLYFDGSNDGIFVPNGLFINFGTGNFTLEFWMYQLSSAGTQVILDAWNYSPLRFLVRTSGTSLQFYGPGGDTSYTLPATNVWYHVAAVRNGSTFTLYVGGTSRGTWSSSDAMNASTSRWAIGGPSEGYNGYLDDIRITRFARYTSNFTPPTSAFITF
jgi:hypothetical protein